MSAQGIAFRNSSRRNLPRIYALEAKYEFLKLLRLPMYAIPTLVFPLMFYLLFGVAMKRGTFDVATYMLATYGVFGVMNATLFGFGVGIAVERGQGWMLFKRATPMPPLAHLAGRLAMALLFSALIVGLLFASGAALGGVRMPAASWAALGGLLVAGALPFAAFGLAIGYWAGPNSAPAIVNLVAMPVSFASGLWIPLQFLPGLVAEIAPFLPPYHLAQLALKVVGMDQGVPAWRSLAVLAGFTVFSLLLARAGYRRDEGRTFG